MANGGLRSISPRLLVMRDSIRILVLSGVEQMRSGVSVSIADRETEGADDPSRPVVITSQGCYLATSKPTFERVNRFSPAAISSIPSVIDEVQVLPMKPKR